MKAHHLVFNNSIDINPRLGTILLNEKRMALMSVEALGLLRRDLVSTLSMDRAKGFLLRYGWACGFNDAESLKKMYDWDSREELILAGPALHTLEGVVTVDAEELYIGEDRFYMSGYWRNSFEAEEHIRHFGYSDEAVCWMLIGYATGFLANTFGKEVVIYEKCCKGKKDEHCYFIAQTVENCSPEQREILRYYQNESLTTELDDIHKELKMLNKSIIRSEEVQKQLTNLLLEGKSLSSLIEVIANVLGRSVLIERGTSNYAFETHIIREKDYESYKKWRKNSKSHRENIDVFPIMANMVSLGKMVIVGGNPLNKEAEQIIERSLSILAIHIHTQKVIGQSLWQEKINFFDELMEENHNPSLLVKKAKHIFDLDFEKENRIIVIKSAPIDRLEDIHFVLSRKYVDQDIFIKKGYIVMILNKACLEKPSIETFMKQIQSLISQYYKNVKVYIGVGRISCSINEIGESYQDAFHICDFLSIAYPTTNKAVIFENLDPIMLFLKSTKPKDLLLFYENILGDIIKYDESNDSNFMETLKLYLENNGNVNQTAQELNLSIPGLRYRLEKIETLVHADLKTGTGRFQCQLATQVYYTLKTIQQNKKRK
ncbi:XylR N-terminal domain-containing protein [Bacillus massiliigorillae]|uniref:XylR N-terminal domain-containing protein n=1 Tax=Bacillus massiliigorillae TaxID=1243664 RepID=UPI0005AA944C|nr:XylR N-terminal domain-containing protein [Bacillus massiliigorillae]